MKTTTQTTKASTPPLWRNHNYLLWLASDTGSALGIAIHSFVIPLIALFITNSPAQAGIIGALGMLGRMLGTLPGGVIADRYDRRRLMMLGSGLGLLIGLALTLAAATQQLNFATLVGLHLIMSVRNGLFASTSDAALKDLLPDAQLGSALAANQGRDAVVALAGGPLGGVLMAFSNTVVMLVIAAAHALASLAATFMALPSHVARVERTPSKSLKTQEATEPGWFRGFVGESGQGLRWLWQRGDLRMILIVSVVVNLGSNAAISSTVFALQQRGESAATIGLVSASIGVGLLLGSFAAPSLIKHLPSGALACGGLLVVAGSQWVLAFMEPVAAICVVLGFALCAAPAINAGIGGYFMAAVPTELLGRATSASALMSMGALPLAPLIAGFGFPLWGWTGLQIFCAGITTIACALALKNRPLRTIPKPMHWAQYAADYTAPTKKSAYQAKSSSSSASDVPRSGC